MRCDGGRDGSVSSTVAVLRKGFVRESVGKGRLATEVRRSTQWSVTFERHSQPRASPGVIQYITTNGIGNAWVANEVRQVEAAGIQVGITALWRDSGSFFDSEWATRLDRTTDHLYPIPILPCVVAFIAAPFRFGSRFWSSLWNALTGPRESLTIRAKSILHLAVACHWAARIRGRGIERIHSQWIHSAGTVGMYAAKLLGVPFSFTGHAADLFRERCALTDKIRVADRIICISEFHRRFFLEQGAAPSQLAVVYCGIDVDHFTPRPPRQPDGRLEIRSSGRLVEKKGFADLIAACGVLRDRGTAFRCVIGGSGPLESDLRRRIAEAGLQELVELTGAAIKQERIPEFMDGGDVYCLPCVWASDDDVDGLPQMLMEAMACGLPAVSTRLVGIPDLVVDGETGLLVEPGDVHALADALEHLGNDAELRRRMSIAARAMVEDRFNLRTCLGPLLELFGVTRRASPDVAAMMVSAS
jgi:colanic acid/amylovoran biosynthesis glycosyltransferase